MMENKSDHDPPKPRVLFVDDERVIADTAVMILNQSGYEAYAAYSGEAALELAPLIKPDIIMSGIVMYELNGVEAAILLHEMLPATRIILHSGWAGAADLLENARDRGYEFEIIAKPIHPQDLCNLLSTPSDPGKIYNPDRIRNPPHPIPRWYPWVPPQSAEPKNVLPPLDRRASILQECGLAPTLSESPPIRT